MIYLQAACKTELEKKHPVKTYLYATNSEEIHCILVISEEILKRFKRPNLGHIEEKRRCLLGKPM